MEDKEIELKLYELMRELQLNSIELENATIFYNNIIKNNMKEIEEVSKPYNKISEEIQNKIKEFTLIRKESLKTGSGNITYVKGAVRRSWNLDALDTICETDDYVREKIWDLRDEKEGEPQVRIKIDLKGISVTDI